MGAPAWRPLSLRGVLFPEASDYFVNPGLIHPLTFPAVAGDKLITFVPLLDMPEPDTQILVLAILETGVTFYKNYGYNFVPRR